MRVYLLSHTRNETELDGYKIVGAFSSKAQAEAAISTVKQKPGFKDYPDGFHIDGYDIDKVFWSDGFG